MHSCSVLPHPCRFVNKNIGTTPKLVQALVVSRPDAGTDLAFLKHEADGPEADGIGLLPDDS